MVYRFDYLRLSSEDKPEPVVDGSSLYEVDTQKLYIYYKGTWYLQGEDTEESSNATENSNERTIEKIEVNTEEKKKETTESGEEDVKK